MAQNYYTEEAILLFFGLIFLICFIIISIWFNNIAPFLKERKEIKMDMDSCFDEKEYRCLKRELKDLYLRSIPIIGRFFR